MTELDLEETVAQVAELIREANSLLFVTGAGVSADSGLPTYRGVGGLYNREETEDGVPIEAALSGPMFASRPALTWKYLWQIGSACVGAEPNAAHQLMARLESERPDVWVITQNVDGLHRSAGSTNLVEVHGNAFELSCTRCRREFTAEEMIAGYEDLAEPPELPPKCVDCGSIVRPNVVLFEETLSTNVCESLDRLSARDFDIVFAVGTSALFPYIAHPFAMAHYRDRPTVEINPTTTSLSAMARYRIPLSATAVAELIAAQLWPE